MTVIKDGFTGCAKVCKIIQIEFGADRLLSPPCQHATKAKVWMAGLVW